MQLLRSAPLAALVGLALAVNPARATFHLWDIVEAYSNFDGSVQFVEMFDASNFENQMAGRQLKSSSHTFTIPANLTTTATANHRLLFATDGFAALAGGVTPDFVIPQNFFSVSGDTLNFANVDVKTFASIPTDGLMSLNYSGSTPNIAANTPTNFANDSGSVNLPPPMTTGDYNGDGTVNAADYTVWRNTVGQTVANFGDGADGHADGLIDQADYEFWKTRFGEVVAGGAAALTVPEPATLAMAVPVIFAVIFAASRARRRCGSLQ